MNSKNKNGQVNRRQFLRTSSGVALFVGAGGLLRIFVSCNDENAIQEHLTKHELSAWVKLSSDGQISIFNPAAEMGQGSMTALPVIFAEEMDADWEQVRVAFSPQVPEIYGSSGWGPNRKGMLTAGSRTVKGYFMDLRKAGAQARRLLLTSVANAWQVPLEELSTEPSMVIHQKSNRQISYGDIVEILEIPETLPSIKEEDLKDPKDFRLIGKDLPRYDIPAKVNGSAQFAIDIQLPDMLYGVMERGALHGAKPTLKNKAEILALPGIIKVHTIDYAVGIIGESLEQVLSAKKQLSIEWSEATASSLNSQDLFDKYTKIAATGEASRVITQEGDFQKAMRSASKTYTADFKNDYIYHAQMEPLNAVVKVAEDLQSVEVWVGSQQGFNPKMGVPRALGLEPEQVKVNLQYLGGGLGRRSMTDYVEECALLAKEVAPKPLKLLWTREDDVRYGAFRPLSLQRIQACVDATGNLTGFSHTVIGDGDNLVASGIKNAFYSIPNQHAEIRRVPEGVRLKHWRAVGHGPNKFAIECMIDEIARDQGQDPVDFRKKLMKNAPRALATLEKAATMANWGAELPEGRAKGVAFLERSGTLSTGICEISLDESTGKIRVHNFWSANDAGIIIQPDNVKAQMEGGIIMGMSSVFNEQITLVDGKVQQSNFHDYSLLRMEDIPAAIETELIASNEAPQGVGESGTPLVACAVANAFFALTGKHLRHLPFTKERVLEVLNA